MKSDVNHEKVEADGLAGDISQGKEIEIKFRTSRKGLAALQDSGILAPRLPLATKQLNSTYFDTAEHALDNKAIILRVRSKGDGSLIQCVKTPGAAHDGPFIRNEEEIEVDTPFPDPRLFAAKTRKRLHKLTGGSPLLEQFETRITRSIAIVDDHAKIEMALDDGVIHAGELSTEIHEVELELIEGSESQLIEFARKLVVAFPLCLDFASKAEKGFRLASRLPPQPVKAKAVMLDHKSDVEAAIIAVISECLKHFCANLDPFRLGEDPESVHQLRVALRRLRSALALFDKATGIQKFGELRRKAKAIANVLAETRSFDALLEMARLGPQAFSTCPPEMDVFIAEMQSLRAAGCNAAWAAFEGPEISLFVLDVRAALASRQWRENLEDEAIEALAGDLPQMAARTLSRLHKHVIRLGDKLDDLDDGQRHELRIKFKNLRYAAEFFGCLFERPRQYRAYVSAVSTLQDILGSHNDVVATRVFLDGLPRNAERDSAAGYLLGWYDRQAQLSDRKLAKCWKIFCNADQFWT